MMTGIRGASNAKANRAGIDAGLVRANDPGHHGGQIGGPRQGDAAQVRPPSGAQSVPDQNVRSPGGVRAPRHERTPSDRLVTGQRGHYASRAACQQRWRSDHGQLGRMP